MENEKLIIENKKCKIDNSHWSNKRYQAYQDSGIEWIGKIPKKWNIRKIKSVCSHVKDGTHGSFQRVDQGYPLLSVRNIIDSKFVLLDDDSFISEKDYREISKSLKIKEGDLQLAIVGATLGKVALVSGDMPDFVTQRSLATLRPIKQFLHNKFLFYFAISSYFQNILWSNTSYSAQPGIYLNTISNIDILIPYITEQKQIARYLDRQTAQIDRKIDLLTQKANKYKELKKSLINETVTRGLDKSVAMKDSGIEWIGKIPKHWEVRRIKDILLPNHLGIKIGPFGSSLKLEMMKNEGYKIYGQEHVINNDFKIGHKYIDVNKFKELQNYEIVSGDIVITMMGTVGKSKVVPEGIKKGIMDSHLIRIRVIKSVSSYLLSLSINESKYIYDQRKSFSKGSIMEGLNSRIIKCLKVVVPPLSEQKVLARYLDKKTAHCDKIITTINQQIEKLKELRKTLINDVVTGKIKVVNN